MNFRVLSLTLAGVLASCGGNVKSQQCTGIDWDQHGYKSAKTGKSVRDFDKFRDGCGDRLEAGATNAYLDGYARGIAEFCTYENGYAQGYANKAMQDICPVELRTAYEKGHKSGLFDINVRIQNLKELDSGKGMSEDVEEMGAFKKE